MTYDAWRSDRIQHRRGENSEDFLSTEQTQYSYVNIVCVQACMNKEKPSDEKLVPKQKKRQINMYKYIVYALTLNTNVRFMVDILVARLDDKYFS